MILEVCRDGFWTLPFGLSQFHGHGSWLVCEVALSARSTMLHDTVCVASSTLVSPLCPILICHNSCQHPPQPLTPTKTREMQQTFETARGRWRRGRGRGGGEIGNQKKQGSWPAKWSLLLIRRHPRDWAWESKRESLKKQGHPPREWNEGSAAPFLVNLEWHARKLGRDSSSSLAADYYIWGEQIKRRAWNSEQGGNLSQFISFFNLSNRLFVE